MSVRSRASRGDQFGLSEWRSLRWTIKYVIPDLLLAASWAAPRRLHLLAIKPTLVRGDILYEIVQIRPLSVEGITMSPELSWRVNATIKTLWY